MQALANKKMPYQSNASVSKRRRSQPATSVAHSGAPMHITTAVAVMSCPATGTETCKLLLMSLSVPGTTMTPVPITKLPNKSGHSTRGNGALARGSACGGALSLVSGCIVVHHIQLACGGVQFPLATPALGQHQHLTRSHLLRAAFGAVQR